jgi:SAM-dependent methyltransferase
MPVVPSLAHMYLTAAEENKRAIERMMIPRAGGVLLDVGCADGSDSIRLAHRVGAAQTIGLELADQFIGPARGRGVDVRQVDISEEWPIPSASVDAVHSNQVIEHLAQTDHFMREIRRVLRPDGYAVVSTNNLASWHNIASLLLGWQPLPCHVSDENVVGNPMALEEKRYGPRIHRHLRIFTGRALAALAESHGLVLDEAVGSGYYPFGAGAAGVMAKLDRRHSVYLVQRYLPAARG